MECPKCKNIPSINDKFCHHCGHKLNSGEVEMISTGLTRCDSCGASVGIEDVYCGNCGKNISKNEEQVTRCNTCNSLVSSEDAFCLECGSKLKDIDIISSQYLRNYNDEDSKKYNTGTTITISGIALAFSLVLSGFFPILLSIFSAGALSFAIYKFVIIKNKTTGWSIAFSSLALLFGILGIVNGMVDKQYAYKSLDRISEEINVDLPEVEPSFYDISIMDGQVTSVTLTPYSFNDLIYKLSDEEALKMEEEIAFNSSKFSDVYIEDLYAQFNLAMMVDVDISLVYNVKDKTFQLPSNLSEYDLIIVNYNYESKTLQILEVIKVEM